MKLLFFGIILATMMLAALTVVDWVIRLLTLY